MRVGFASGAHVETHSTRRRAGRSTGPFTAEFVGKSQVRWQRIATVRTTCR
ncbi:Hypothetical protein A7982_01994 [Minicystis rosea]|nr:Hypothetical protein A7982_01994 [Minicystis rosea]